METDTDQTATSTLSPRAKSTGTGTAMAITGLALAVPSAVLAVLMGLLGAAYGHVQDGLASAAMGTVAAPTFGLLFFAIGILAERRSRQRSAMDGDIEQRWSLAMRVNVIGVIAGLVGAVVPLLLLLQPLGGSQFLLAR